MKKSSTRSKRIKKKSRRTRGGYNKVKNGQFYNRSYSVEFTPEEEQKIKEYKQKNPTAMPDDILDALFPNMKPKYRNSTTSNTIYKIQLLIGTAYSGSGER